MLGIENSFLSEYSSISEGGDNKIVMAILFAVEEVLEGVDKRNLIVLMKNGKGITVQLPKQLWKEWEKCSIGNVISFHGDVKLDKYFTKCYVVATSKPVVIMKMATPFKVDVTHDIENFEGHCCVVATVEGVPTRGDEKRPARVMCNTGLNIMFRLTAFCVQQKEIIERLEVGQVIHVGVARMCEEEYRGRSMKMLICSSSTVIDTLGKEFPLTMKRESVGNKVIVGASYSNILMDSSSESDDHPSGSRWQKSCNDNPVDQEKVRTQDMSNGQPLKGDKNLIKKIDTKRKNKDTFNQDMKRPRMITRSMSRESSVASNISMASNISILDSSKWPDSSKKINCGTIKSKEKISDEEKRKKKAAYDALRYQKKKKHNASKDSSIEMDDNFEMDDNVRMNSNSRRRCKVQRQIDENPDEWKARRSKTTRQLVSKDFNETANENGNDVDMNSQLNEDEITTHGSNLKSLNKRKTHSVHSSERDYSLLANAVPKQLDLGQRKECDHCGALTYTYRCCENGNVRIPPPRDPPLYIRNLLTSASNASKHFRQEIVKYNNSLGMGAMSYDREKTKQVHPYVKVNGMVHHMVGGAAVPDNKTPLFHQCYKYDVNEATKWRVMNPRTGNFIRSNIIRNLQMIMEEENYLVKQYKSANEIMMDLVKHGRKITKNVFVVLRTPNEVNYQGSEHPSTLSQPIKNDINSFIYTTEPDGGPTKHGLYIVHKQFKGKLKVLGYWNPLQDPISYPLLFPYGNSGYRRKDYKLNVDYTQDNKERDMITKLRQLSDPYPFEEYDGDDPCVIIDYEAARLKYKEELKNNGNEVSDSEDEDFFSRDLDSDNEDSIDMEDVVDDVRDDAQDPLRKGGIEIHNLEDNNEDVATHNFFHFGENDEESEVNEEVEVPLKKNNEKFNEMHEVRKEKQVTPEEIEETPKKTIEEIRKEEAEEVRKYLIEETKALWKYQKLKNFKKLCMATSEFDHYKYFQPEELESVRLDIAFMRRKEEKHKEYMINIANEILNLDYDQVVQCFAMEGELERLEHEIEREVEHIYLNPNYRNDEEKIRNFRKKNLCPNLQDENEADEVDSEVDLVQHEIDEDPCNQKETKKWKKGKPVQNKGPRKYVSRREHGLHQFQIRDKTFHPYLSTLLLGQLYVIDVALRYIRDRNDTQRDHMISLRGANEKNFLFQKHARSATKKGFEFGYAFQLPMKRHGSTQWYRREFENAMATVDKTGKPDLFITMTGNPDWPEIQNNLLPNTKWQSNPFLVNDVFYAKQQQLLLDIIEKEIFGPVVGYCYSIEFQKRGMPHMHLLVTLKDGYKLDTSEKIDKIIKASIPDEPSKDDDEVVTEKKMRYRKNVIDRMLHTSCVGDDKAYCTQRPQTANNLNKTFTRCTKYFPFPFNNETSTTDGGTVQYHRPDDGNHVLKEIKGPNKTTKMVTNQHVVPYNPFLLNKYNCHINVEAVTTVDVIKYIYKYIYKGFDKALAQFIEAADVDDGASGRCPPIEIHASRYGDTGVMLPRGVKCTEKQIMDMTDRIGNEIHKYNLSPNSGQKITAYDEAITVEVFRQMTSSEAAYILQGYKQSGNSHEIINLSVHEENKMNMYWRSHETDDDVRQKYNDGKYLSELLGWFELNKNCEFARQFTFEEIPHHFGWKRNGKCEWTKYINPRKNKIIRIRPVSPRYLQCFAVRLLCKHQRGCTSFADLRTVNGIVYDTPHEAAKAAKLMNSQMEFDSCLADAASFKLPYQMRQLFATMLVFSGLEDPRGLWIKYKKEFFDIRHVNFERKATAAALHHIEYIISLHSFTLSDFNLPEADCSCLSEEEISFAINGGFMMPVRDEEAEVSNMEKSLNEDQKKAYDIVINAVESNGKDGNCFFLQGSGGCGKTYLYKTIYARLNLSDIPVCMLATTGIAATLLIKGTTAHRKFRLPLDADETSNSSMAAESKEADELKKTTAFIIDEATMASKFNYECIDKLLRNLTGNQKPFGGKIILLGGDWKQLLPVVPNTSSNQALQYTLKADLLWKHFKVLTLSKNMRAEKDKDYAMLLENIGNGLVNGEACLNVRLPPSNIAENEDEIIDFIYGDITKTASELSKSCVLAPLNAETAIINDKVLDMLPGQAEIFNAIDTPKDGIGMQIPPEYFRNEMLPGMPPFELKLKVGAIVILLRNLCVAKGLCNGTRLEVTDIRAQFIICKLLTTDFKGTTVWVAKIISDPTSNGKKNSNYSRFQFPLRLAYSMSINKAQGQTFERVGIVLKNNVFAHGQLYVALSRARDSNNVKICSSSYIEENGKKIVVIKNKVETEVLEVIDKISWHSIIAMAQDFVNHYSRGLLKLTSFDDIIKLNHNDTIPMATFLILSKDTDEVKKEKGYNLYGCITLNGSAIPIKVNPIFWQEWDKVIPGMVVSFEGKVSFESKVFHDGPSIMVMSMPKIKRSISSIGHGIPLKHEPCENSSVIGIVNEVLGTRSNPHVNFVTKKGQLCKFMGGLPFQKNILKEMKIGDIIYAAPIYYTYSKFSPYNNKHSIFLEDNTAIFNAGRLQDETIHVIEKIEDIQKVPIGHIIKMTKPILRTIHNGMTSAIDFNHEQRNCAKTFFRVLLIGIQDGINGFRGDVFDITAMVINGNNDSRELVCLTMDKSIKYPGPTIRIMNKEDYIPLYWQHNSKNKKESKIKRQYNNNNNNGSIVKKRRNVHLKNEQE